jgi:hypothetical protein
MAIYHHRVIKIVKGKYQVSSLATVFMVVR